METLDDRQILSGFAEVIKHGLIKDKDLFIRCKAVNLPEIPEGLVYDSVVIKNSVITEDPTEKGIRKILNFGHTIGHAIEGYSLVNDVNPLLHGEAIAIGMVCEAYLSYKFNNLEKSELDEIVSYLQSIYPSYQLNSAIYPELLDLMKNDKKNEGNKLGFALLRSIGDCDFNKFVEEDAIVESLDFYQTLTK